MKFRKPTWNIEQKKERDRGTYTDLLVEKFDVVDSFV